MPHCSDILIDICFLNLVATGELRCFLTTLVYKYSNYCLFQNQGSRSPVKTASGEEEAGSVHSPEKGRRLGKAFFFI